ncbi:MAG: hypothetical protein M1814_006630 [Vezdaea aestivalis]|nr:MAG: hypothetical protein M1814_006630 [Vezdaea aestivalis]
MATTNATQAAATTSRKARLAELQSKKRKQPPTEESPTTGNGVESAPSHADDPPDVTKMYLSGRNYDPNTRGPKLGFDTAPQTDQVTVEEHAQKLSEEQKVKDREEAARNNGEIDLFALQPKKRNWDLKRDLKKKTRTLDIRTDNAIARLVRDRLLKNAEGGSKGLEGSALVEAVKVRERETLREQEENDDGDTL